MELFKFNYTTDPTVLERGEKLNGMKSIMWAERYRDAGEFEIRAMLSSGLREQLPIGTIIGHADTYEIMIVENLEITEEPGEDPEFVVTGRSLEVLLENRIIGMNLTRANNSAIVPYDLGADWSWNHAVYLINDHIGNPTYTDDNLVNIQAISHVGGTVGTSAPRSFKREELYKTVVELLTIDDCGIRTIRRNTFGYPAGSPSATLFSIYRGADKSSKVIFSWKSGHLGPTEYLWSEKLIKNSALILGRFVNTTVDTAGVTKFNRKTMLVTADDIDGSLTAPPTGSVLTDVINKMQVRGRIAIDNQNRITIVKSDISSVTPYQYRLDYNVGDLVTLDGNFGVSAIMRVIEYVEIEDEEGESGHPTLSVPLLPVAGMLGESVL